MSKLFEVASKYFKKHIFIVNKKELYNKFESKLFKYKRESVDDIGTKFVNYINNDPFNNMIKKISPDISTSHGFYVSKHFEHSYYSQVFVIPFGFSPVHNFWRIRDIIERDNDIAEINSYFTQKRDKNYFPGKTYPVMDECDDPYSPNPSLSDLTEKYDKTPYLKELCNYVKNSESEFKDKLKIIDEIFYSFDDKKREELLRETYMDAIDLKSRFLVKDKNWVSYDGVSSANVYNNAVKFMMFSKHLHVFGKCGLSPAHRCEGGFAMKLSCHFTNFIRGSDDDSYGCQLIRGTGHILPNYQGTIPYSGDMSFPFWANVYLRESIEDFGVKTKNFSHNDRLKIKLSFNTNCS
jgi:hypothetical protein